MPNLLLVGMAVFAWGIPAWAYLNGRAESGLPAVASYRIDGTGICNGTFIFNNPGQPDVMLTAGHCLKNATPQSRIVLANGGRIGAQASQMLNVDAAGGLTSRLDSDIALILFPSGTATASMPLSPTPVSPGDEVSSASWHPKGAGKFGGDNVVTTYNLRATDKAVVGYVLSETTGGMPNLGGESGSPLVTDEGVIGVFTGTVDLSDINRRWSGLAGVFMSIHPEEMMDILIEAQQRYPQPFAGLDFNDFVMFQKPTHGARPADHDFDIELPAEEPPEATDRRRSRQPTRDIDEEDEEPRAPRQPSRASNSGRRPSPRDRIEPVGGAAPVVGVGEPALEPADPPEPKLVPLSATLRSILDSNRAPRIRSQAIGGEAAEGDSTAEIPRARPVADDVRESLGTPSQGGQKKSRIRLSEGLN